MVAPQTVYVPVRGFDEEVWRPVFAQPLMGLVFRLMGPQPENEDWVFTPGQAVRCTEHLMKDGETVWLAAELVE
jgi:hypothetical protein